jgi:hypothetical protein
MTELPVIQRARELSCQHVLRGPALERGILNGYCDEGHIVTDFLNEAEQSLLRDQMEENIPDD